MSGWHLCSARSRRMVLGLGTAILLAGAAALGPQRATPAAAQIYVSPGPVPAAFGYDPTSGQVNVTGNALPVYISVDGTQPLTTYSTSSPITTITYAPGTAAPLPSSYLAPGTYVEPGATGTTYVQENTTIPPPNINGVPYVVAGAEQWVSPGGSYCSEPGGGQVWVPTGASPVVYGC